MQPGEVVVIRYEGPKGGPGMQEMLYPTSLLKAKARARCALLTDGRFSGGSSGLSIGHVSPEAAEGGALALVEDGDRIEIDIPQRSIRLDVRDEELGAAVSGSPVARGNQGWKPAARTAHGLQGTTGTMPPLMTTSASRGAVREF